MSRTALIASALLCFLVISVGEASYFLNSKTTETTTLTQTSTTRQVVIAPTTRSITETTSQTITAVVTSTINGIIPPINDVTISNITVGDFAWNVVVDPQTNMVYEGGPFSNLTVINASSNKIVGTIDAASSGSQFLAVNPATDRIYDGDAVIDGATDKVIERLGFNSSGIAVDLTRNLVYGLTQDSTPNGNTTLKIFNGYTDSLVANILLNGSAEAIAINSQTHILYIPICSELSACTPSYLLVINGSSYTIISKLFLGSNPAQDSPLSIALNLSTNMIYVTTQQLVSINGTTNQIVARTSVSAFAFQCRGVAVNPVSNEIYVTGWGLQNFGSFFIVNGENYSVLNVFVGTLEPVGVAYDETNSEIYVVNSGTNSLLVLNSTSFI